jgi:hypothetical protein
MTTGERKIEITHIQRNIILDQVLLSAGMFASPISVSISSIDIDRRVEVRGISPSCSPASVSISDAASSADNDISMDHSGFILLAAVEVRLRNGSSRKSRSLLTIELRRRKKQIGGPESSKNGRQERKDVGDTILITGRIIDLKSAG